MPNFMYVALQEDDQISVLEIDPQTGKLAHQAEVSITGGPSSPWQSALTGSFFTLAAATLLR